MEFEEEVHCCLVPSKSFLHFFSFIMVKIWNPGWNISQINLSTLCMCVCIYIYMYMCECVYVCKGFPDSSVVKNLPTNAEDVVSTPGSGRSPGEGKGKPLQYFCLGNLMDKGAWWAAVYGIMKELYTTQWLNSKHPPLQSEKEGLSWWPSG